MTKDGAPILYLLLLATLVPWVIASFLSVFAFDAPGSDKNPVLWRIVISIWCYPLLAGACAITGFALRRSGLWKAGAIVLAIPSTLVATALGVVVFMIALTLFQDYQSRKTSPNVRYTNNGLEEIPSEVFNRPTPVDSLNFNGNRLTQLPPEIAQLKHLRYLSLADNQLTSLPAEIGQLTELMELNLSGNRLESLPPEFAQLAKLRVLRLDGNPMKEFPLPLTRLNGLETLYLSNVAIKELPSEIGAMAGLQELWLLNGQLVSVPPELAKLEKLKLLELSSNQLRTLPVELAQMPSLKSLDVTKNPLETLPPEVAALKVLQRD